MLYELAFGFAPRFGPSTAPIPKQGFDSVVNDQQLKSPQLKSSERDGDAVFANETTLNQTVKVF